MVGAFSSPEQLIAQHRAYEKASAPVSIPREAYDFLMGVGPLEGVWFGELHEGLPGAFWWRGVLASAAGWPEPAAKAIDEGSAII